MRRQMTFWQDEGVLATITASARGQSGIVFASNGSSAHRRSHKNLPSLAITAEHYNRIARLLEHNVPVKLSSISKSNGTPRKTEAFNVIAEIPGAGQAE